MKHKPLVIVLCAALGLGAAVALPAAGQEDPAVKRLEESGSGVLALVAYDKDKKEIARGSAISLAKDLAVTNYHLISGAASVMGFNAKKKEVDVEGILAVNKAFDLALIRIKGRTTPLVPTPEALTKGKKFLALGSNESGEIVVSSGEIREVRDLGAGLMIGEASIAVPDAFAGGPVFGGAGPPAPFRGPGYGLRIPEPDRRRPGFRGLGAGGLYGLLRGCLAGRPPLQLGR
jgi:hypothetical protein